MPISKVWIYRLLFVCFVILCVCTVTDFSAEDKASGVKFCVVVHRCPGQGISHFGEFCYTRSSKSDESASHREVKFTVRRPSAKVTLEMCRSWNMAPRVDRCGYSVPTDVLVSIFCLYVTTVSAVSALLSCCYVYSYLFRYFWQINDWLVDWNYFWSCNIITKH